MLSFVRPIGLIGGMSWESTALYYQLINRGVARRLGALCSAEIRMHSVDFAPYAEWMRNGEWAKAGEALAAAAAGLERIGATAVVMTSNTLHQVAPVIEAAISVPLLHIVDATGAALRGAGVRLAGLLGTRYTMELPFFRDRLAERFGIELEIPGAEDRQVVHDVIFEELVRGVVEDGSRAAYLEVIGRLAGAGAEAVVFGCTEIGMLLSGRQSPLPVFDTTELHSAVAVEWIAGGDSIGPS
jgi:aspartate racemase